MQARRLESEEEMTAKWDRGNSVKKNRVCTALCSVIWKVLLLHPGEKNLRTNWMEARRVASNPPRTTTIKSPSHQVEAWFLKIQQTARIYSPTKVTAVDPNSRLGSVHLHLEPTVLRREPPGNETLVACLYPRSLRSQIASGKWQRWVKMLSHDGMKSSDENPIAQISPGLCAAISAVKRWGR